MPLLYWAKSNLFISAPLLLLLFVFLRELLLRSTRGNKALFNVLLFPGVVVHELSHAGACLLLGAKIVDIDLFTYGGGKVVYRFKRGHLYKNFFISSAPLIIGILILYLIASSFLGPFAQEKNLALIALLFYFALSLTITMMPSAQDFKNSYLAYILLFVIIFFASYLFREKLIYADKVITFLLLANAVIVTALIISFFYRLVRSLVIFKK